MDTDENEAKAVATEGEGGLRGVVAENPWATATLLSSIVIGAAISVHFVTGDLSFVRKLCGGAIFGGLGWLLVMMGRVI